MELPYYPSCCIQLVPVVWERARSRISHPRAPGRAVGKVRAPSDRIARVVRSGIGIVAAAGRACWHHGRGCRCSGFDRYSIRVDERTRAALRATTAYTDALRTAERTVMPLA